ncbi:PAS domain-containing protein [Streptomyces sp. NPDC101234]|uniref:SpoIIE family protein phosphatase n=1 Tax=Streptomyces sp. NPDC101234 TaxID=3366138 RepID=UPI0037F513BC
MIDNDELVPGSRPNIREPSESAIAMLDDQGTVVGWTRAAERLVGYSAGDVVGRSASAVLPHSEEAPTTAEFVDRCRARRGWSGTTTVRHRDGHGLDVSLRVSMLWGHGETVRWLVSVTDIGEASAETTNGLVRESLLARVPMGIVVRDPQLRCTWVNDTMESHDGISRERRLGRRFTDVRPGAEAETLESAMREVMRGGPAKVQDHRTWLPSSPHREHAYAASVFCLQDADGQVLGVCVISVDLTESRRARDRLAILSEGSTRLGSSLDVMRTSQELADLAVPLLADYVAVDLEQSVPFGEGPPVHIGSTGQRLPVFRRAGLASIHHGVPESPWAHGEVVPWPPDSPVTDVLCTGMPHLEPILDTAPGTWIDQDPARARKIHENGIHSMMLIPIRARRVLLGMVLLVRTSDPGPFQEIDVLLAEELVSRAALALDNARQYAREHTAALALQRNLLPHRLKGGAAVETASRYLPADLDHGIGGDWFDVIPLSGARVALVVGDVVGHGINAAATKGSLLGLYTDGLIETRDHDIDVGMHRLGTALAQPGRSLEDVCSRAMETLPGQAPSDDATLLLVRTRTISPDQVASWTLPSDQTAARSARCMAARQLDEWDLGDLEDATKLIVSELVTNAVRHGNGRITLRLIRHQVLTCEVFDTSACSPRPRSARTSDENGRGLFLVAQVSRRWGFRSVAGGKVVWAEEELAPASAPARTLGTPPVIEEHPVLAPVPPPTPASRVVVAGRGPVPR